MTGDEQPAGKPDKPEPERTANPTSHPEPERPVPPPTPHRKNAMSLWMTTRQVAEESGRHIRTVNDALRRGLLTGVQPGPNACWQISRTNFNRWVEAGRPWQHHGRRSA